MINLDKTHIDVYRTAITISGSKSESNRVLILQKLFPQISLQNLSDSDDTTHLIKALQTNNNLIDIGHAGTAMRFLTAYFAAQPHREVILTGSSRMQERPIQLLVDALNSLGANITYLKNQGFPPLQIKGAKLLGGTVTLPAHVSSQYISALLLIAPTMEKGLTLQLEGTVTSLPYIQMTLSLLKQVGVAVSFTNNQLIVNPLTNKNGISPTITIESDWSSASYFYSTLALSNPGSEITLSYYKQDSLQGDSALATIYKDFCVETEFLGQSIRLTKNNQPTHIGKIRLDLNQTPDIAQTIVVTCLGLGIECELTGLQTLRIKETDRLTALKNELEKFGATVTVTDNNLTLKDIPNPLKYNGQPIKTYDDHRMAMAFAPLSLITPLAIENPEVVTKSYQNFWEDFEKIK